MRTIKQFIYGIGFLVVVGLIFWGVNTLLFSGPPTCFDEKQNQGEMGVDCGGPCMSCALKNVQDIQVKFAKAFSAQGGVGVVAEIYNPNIQVAAQRAYYQLVVKDNQDQVLETVSGETFLYAGELKYIVVPFINRPLASISSAGLTVSDPEWVSSDTFSKPSVEVQAVQTKKSESVRVEGKVVNRSEFGVSRPVVSALLYNRSGELIAASRTVLDDIEKFSAKDFIVVFSQDMDLYQPTFQIGALFGRDLTIGDSGQDVGTLQVLLAELGLLVREPTNYYDDLTAWAVSQLQAGFGLESTGIFDEASRTKIIQLLEEQVTQLPEQDRSVTVDPSKTKVFVEVKR